MSDVVDYKEFFKLKMQVDDLKKLAKTLGPDVFDGNKVQMKQVGDHKQKLTALDKRVGALEKGGKRR